MRVQVKVTGLDELKKKYAYASKSADKYMSAAGKEAAELYILAETGIKKYPPATEANMPGRFNTKTHRPMGYYERGKGYWRPIMRKGSLQEFSRVVDVKGTDSTRVVKGYRSAGQRVGKKSQGVAGYKLNPTSERYGTKWVVKRVPYGVKIGNSATYAGPLTGATTQSHLMAKYGWRKLIDVANQNMSQITATFQAWIDKLHQDSGLKTK